MAVSLIASGTLAQQRPPYGAAINLETAKKIAAASVAEAKKNNWNVAIAIVDHGLLVYYEIARRHKDGQRQGGHREGTDLGDLPPPVEGV